MHKKSVITSVRLSPLALAFALLAILGLMALQVRAQEDMGESEALMEIRNANVQERKDLFTEQAQERKAQMDQTKEEWEVMHEGSTTPKEVQAFQNERRDDAGDMFEEHREERKELFETHSAEFRNAFEERRYQLEERIKERKAQYEENKTERKARLSENIQMRLQYFIERIADRMNAAIDRMEQITDRIVSRVFKLESEGFDLTEVKADVQNVRVLIGDARAYVVLLSEVSLDTISSDDPEKGKEDMREAVALAKAAIQAVHQTLSEVVDELQTIATEENSEEEETDTVTQDTETNE
jgi:hypothetical protein